MGRYEYETMALKNKGRQSIDCFIYNYDNDRRFDYQYSGWLYCCRHIVWRRWRATWTGININHGLEFS